MTIKEIRKEHKITQSELAKITGIPLRTIEDWERGASKPKDYLINLISEFLKSKS